MEIQKVIFELEAKTKVVMFLDKETINSLSQDALEKMAAAKASAFPTAWKGYQYDVVEAGEVDNER